MFLLRSKKNRNMKTFRKLYLENLEIRQTMNADFDDQIHEARQIQLRGDNPVSVPGVIDNSMDVDMVAISARAGQTIDFDIDTPQNGPGGLGSYIRIFNSQGVQISANNDAAAPGESHVGFDSYLRHTFTSDGAFYIGVSTWTNTRYNAVTGLGDTSGNLHSTGAYQLTVQAMPVDTDDALSESTSIGEVTRTPLSASGQIAWDVDVDMFAFRVNAGQSIDIDLDTPRNGPGGLGSYIRIFNSAGRQLAANDDGAAPGESLGFDSFRRHRFSQGGTYYVGVSNWLNTNYNPISGNNDTPSWQHAVGSYTITLNTTPTGNGTSIFFGYAQTTSSNATSSTSVEKRTVVADTSSTQSNTVVAATTSLDWSVPVRLESNRNTPDASRDNWFASLGQSDLDPLRRLSLSI